MRVIAGTHKSLKLKTLKGDNTRPTSDKVRGAIFSSLAYENNLNTMLDLFSGSGAMGIEALSRGFKQAFFNDLNKNAVKIIKENINSLKLNDKSVVYNLDYKQCIKRIENKVDFIFIDPPYFKFDIYEILELIFEEDILNDNGIIVLEVSRDTLFEDSEYFSVYKEKNYGKSKVVFLRKA